MFGRRFWCGINIERPSLEVIRRIIQDHEEVLTNVSLAVSLDMNAMRGWS